MRNVNNLRCPCCGSSDLRSIYRVENIPTHSCILLGSREEALAFPRRDLELAYCRACAFAFNARLDEAMIGYSTNFEESQHFSGTFSNFAKSLAAETVERCGIEGKRVVEIGCGKGEFLREVCALGGSRGIGIDPAYRDDLGRDGAGGDVEFIVDYFSDAHKALRADVVLCRHTLEHIPGTAKLIRDVRDLVGDAADCWIVFETPDFRRVMAEGAFWDIYYEHCSYFSAGSHARLFRQGRFDVVDLSLRYDDQYIYQYARPASAATVPGIAIEDDLAEMGDLAESFPARVKDSIDRWKGRLTAAASAGRRVALWGGGSKAVSFITTLGLTDEITAVVDVNPYKQGKFIPGSGHPVVSPRQLAEYAPETVIIMNPIYVGEIERSLADLGIDAEVTCL